MPSFTYAQGYKDAIADLYTWFDMPKRKNILKTKGLTITLLLKAFHKYYERFMKVKSDFDFDYIAIKKIKGKKEITEIIITPATSEKKEILTEIKTLQEETENEKSLFNHSGQEIHNIKVGVYELQIEALERKLKQKKMLLDLLQVSNSGC